MMRHDNESIKRGSVKTTIIEQACAHEPCQMSVFENSYESEDGCRQENHLLALAEIDVMPIPCHAVLLFFVSA